MSKREKEKGFEWLDPQFSEKRDTERNERDRYIEKREREIEIISSFRNTAEAWTGYLSVHTYSLAFINWAIDVITKRERGKQKRERQTNLLYYSDWYNRIFLCY